MPPTPDTSVLTPGQKDFYDSLLESDPQAAEDFLNAIKLESERDVDRNTPPPNIGPAGQVEPFVGPIDTQTPIVQDYPENFRMDDYLERPFSMFPRGDDELEFMDEGQKSFYLDQYATDPEGAEQFFTELRREKKEDAPKEPEALQPLTEERALPGFEIEGAKPPPPPSMQALQDQKALQQAQQLIIPDLLDEEQRAGYLAAVDRFVGEGFPDEDKLAGQYGIDFDNQYRQRTGDEPPDENMFNRESAEYSLQRLEFIQNKIADIQTPTAQEKAKEVFFGVKSPRKPRAIGAFEATPTPVRPGLIQQQPELADDMSLSELAVAALSPQVIVPAEQVQRQRQQSEEAKSNIINAMLDYAKANGYDVMKEDQRRQNREEFFTSYRNSLIDEIIATELGPVEGILPTSAPFFYGYTPEEMDELVKEVTPQANVITQGAIKLAFRPTDARGRLGPTPLETEMMDLFPVDKTFMEQVESNIITPTIEFGKEGMMSLTTTKYSPQMRQMLFEGGYIEDPDVITESAGMTVVRDVAGLLRLVVNPAVSGLENLGFIERKAPEEEVETVLPAARREYTESVENSDILGLGEAYLKEVLVETATMRSLGNDIAQLESVGIFGIPLIDENTGGAGSYVDYLVPDALIEYGRDGLVIGGTLAEAFIPLVGQGKSVTGVLGAGTKALSKAPRAVASIPKSAQRFGRSVAKEVPEAARAIKSEPFKKSSYAPLGKIEGFQMLEAGPKIRTAEAIGEAGINLVAGEYNPLFMIVRAVEDYAPTVISNTVTRAKLGRDVAKLAQLQDGQTIAAAAKGNKMDYLTNVFSDTATVEAKVLDQLSEPVLALELRARGGAGAVQKAAADGLISGRSAAMADSLSPQQAEQALKELVSSNTEIMGPMAERALVGSLREYDTAAAIARRQQIRGAGAEAMTKYGLGDYVLLTDKTVVKKSWLDENGQKITDRVVDADGNSKIFDVTKTREGKIRYELKNPGEIAEIARKTNDDYLLELSNREFLDIDESLYVTNRVLDDAALELSPTAFTARKAETLERAEVPLERRGGASGELLASAYETFVPTNLKTTFGNWKKKFLNKPAGKAESATTSATVKRFETIIDEGVARMERTMKGAYGQTNRNIGALDNMFYDAFGFQREVIGISRLGIRTSNVYDAVARLQLNGYSLADISRLTPEEFKAAMEGLSRSPAAQIKNKKFFETYINTLYGRGIVNFTRNADGNYYRGFEQISEYLATHTTDGVPLSAAGPGAKSIEQVSQTAPLFAAKRAEALIERIRPDFKINKAVKSQDVVASMSINLETQRLMKRAMKETFLADEFAVNIRNIQRNLDSAYGQVSDQQALDLISELASLRFTTGATINTMDPGTARALMQNLGLERSYQNYLNAAPGPHKNRIQFLADIEGGLSNSLADYIEITAYKRNLTPAELAQNYDLQMRPLVTENIVGTENIAAVYPLTQIEKDALQTYVRKLGSPDSKMVSDNFAKLQRNTDVFEYATGMMNYVVNGTRRTFVSGQLGGKMLPNIPYQMENLLTANLITYVTNPKYWTTVAAQTVESAFGLTPYRKLRYMAAAKPGEILPGTRLTYSQVYEEFTRRNLGVSNAGLNLGDSFYADLADEAAGWNRFTRGVPGYEKLPEDLKELPARMLEHFKGFGSFLGRTGQDIGQGIGREPFRPYSPTMSPYMKWADETDRAFREAVFVKALQNGESVDTASKLAREVMLDYGMMPGWMRQGVMKSTLYLSFTIASSAELFKAMTTTNGALRVAAMASYHRDLNRYFGSYYSGGDRTLESLYINRTDDPNIVNVYMRSPYLGNLINLGKLTGYGMGIATGRSEDTFKRGKEGLADFFYIPMLEFARELDVEYKKGVPGKQMLRMQQQLYPYNLLSTNPFIMAFTAPMLYDALIADGGNPYYFVDRYDIEIRPMEKRVPGSPTFDGYQYRFRGGQGYNNYLIDQGIMSAAGLQRGFNDYVNALMMEGYFAAPPGVDLTYQGELQRPLLSPGIDYLFLKGRAVRLPTDMELEYRKLKESERRLIDKRKVFEK